MIRKVRLIKTEDLKHIEDYGKKRVKWLRDKILAEGVWKVPLKVEKDLNLVMDGQHRMEVAKEIGLSVVPCLLYSYDEVKVWSLRKNYEVNADLIIERVLNNNIYPYKTAKHAFPEGSELRCEFTLDELKNNEVIK